jgi:hypothetical protein
MCYLVQPPKTSDGMPVLQTTSPVQQSAAGSSTCTGWQAQSDANAKGSAICWTVSGANVNVGTYTTGHVTSDMLKKVTCSDSLLQAQTGSAKVTRFNNGACYLVFSSHTIIQDDCAQILQSTGAADATDKTPGRSADDTTDTVRNNAYDSSLNPSQQQAQIQKDCKASVKNCIQKNPLIQDITAAINLLSALVGVIVIIMIIVGGIQYMTAGGNPQAVAAAKKRITNAVLSIVALIFMFSLLTWLIPGGIF